MNEKREKTKKQIARKNKTEKNAKAKKKAASDARTWASRTNSASIKTRPIPVPTIALRDVIPLQLRQQHVAITVKAMSIQNQGAQCLVSRCLGGFTTAFLLRLCFRWDVFRIYQSLSRARIKNSCQTCKIFYAVCPPRRKFCACGPFFAQYPSRSMQLFVEQKSRSSNKNKTKQNKPNQTKQYIQKNDCIGACELWGDTHQLRRQNVEKHT